jgi:hypothetical protein
VSESLKSAVQAAVLRLLDPLVRLLLASGIGVGDFLALVKVAYVRAARDIGRESRGEIRPNASRIAVVTGLTRAEVASALESDRDEVRSSDRGRHRAERVLSGWWHDPDFQDQAGNPLVLPLRGTKRSFEALVSRHSNETRISPILDELLRVNAVKRLADGRLKAVSRTYATVRWSAEGIETLGEQLSEHCSTLLHNLEHPGRPRYVRRVANVQLDPRYLPVLVRDIEAQAEVLSDHLDEALNDPLHTIKPTGTSQDAVRLSVSIYVNEASVVVEGDTAGANPRGERRGRRSRSGPRASHSSRAPEG